jgi:hypothetical protein
VHRFYCIKLKYINIKLLCLAIKIMRCNKIFAAMDSRQKTSLDIKGDIFYNHLKLNKIKNKARASLFRFG